LVSAATAEVVSERERIAKNAAAAVQAVVQGGYVPGGGTLELAVSRELEKLKSEIKGMSLYGLQCVIEALRKPLMQIVVNAGFNPLEKIGDALAQQAKSNNFALGVDCDSGEIVDLRQKGVIGPTLVKLYVIKTAGEISESILRINTIIKKRLMTRWIKLIAGIVPTWKISI